jgi:hypothetical protein
VFVPSTGRVHENAYTSFRPLLVKASMSYRVTLSADDPSGKGSPGHMKRSSTVIATLNCEVGMVYLTHLTIDAVVAEAMESMTARWTTHWHCPWLCVVRRR